MHTILPLSDTTLSDAARLVTDLRTAMNGRVVCTQDAMASILQQSLHEPSYHGFLAMDGTTGVGYVGLNRRFAIYASGVFFQITELFVDPSARRHGLATRLLHRAEAYALAQGALHLELGAPKQETHPGTYAFYQASGYHTVGPRLSKTLDPIS